MKPYIIGIIVIVIAGALIGGYILGDGDIISGINMGFSSINPMKPTIPEPIKSEPVTEENPEFDDFDIWAILCTLSGKSLDQSTTYEYIDRLNMEVFGSDEDYTEIYGQYSLYYEDNGWTIRLREFPTFPNGDGAIIGYTKGTQGSMVATATSDAISSLYGYNTLTLTSIGSLADYNAFINFIEMS